MEAEEAQSEEIISEENVEQEESVEQEETVAAAEEEQQNKKEQNTKVNNQVEDRSSFIHGLSVGLGVGCIATFIIVWVSIFFTPQLPQALTYENLLSIFIYPLIYLLAVGLVALTAGIVREYYSAKDKV
jgi:fructose-specific phosphotransferase system IIC component